MIQKLILNKKIKLQVFYFLVVFNDIYKGQNENQPENSKKQIQGASNKVTNFPYILIS